MSRIDLWTTAANAMRADEDPRWHAVADWLRLEASLHTVLEPYTELLNLTMEQVSGLKGYIRYARDEKGDVSMHLDSSGGATAVSLAYLGRENP